MWECLSRYQDSTNTMRASGELNCFSPCHSVPSPQCFPSLLACIVWGLANPHVCMNFEGLVWSFVLVKWIWLVFHYCVVNLSFTQAPHLFPHLLQVLERTSLLGLLVYWGTQGFRQLRRQLLRLLCNNFRTGSYITAIIIIKVSWCPRWVLVDYRFIADGASISKQAGTTESIRPGCLLGRDTSLSTTRSEHFGTFAQWALPQTPRIRTGERQTGTGGNLLEVHMHHKPVHLCDGIRCMGLVCGIECVPATRAVAAHFALSCECSQPYMLRTPADSSQHSHCMHACAYAVPPPPSLPDRSWHGLESLRSWKQLDFVLRWVYLVCQWLRWIRHVWLGLT